jgi:hypothetical protein
VRITWRDPDLPHQIVLIFKSGNNIAVSCNCRWRGPGNGITADYEPLEMRTRWDWPDAKAVYEAHLPALAAVEDG